jgi:hypothetical protein
MNISVQDIARLEWANYAVALPIAQATPGLEVLLADDVILTSNLLFPHTDVTHACLVRATAETVESLIDRVIDYFKSKALPTTIFISPACTPADLAERLSCRGFVKNEEKEAWLIFPHLSRTCVPPLKAKVKVKLISRAEISTFIETMLIAFELPLALAPFMVQLTEPSLSLTGIYHYLALVDDQPVGTCSLVCYEEVGVLGGVGVIPTYRGSGAVTNLIVRAAREAQACQVDTLLLQTASATPLERLLRLSGFKKLFTRTAYTLHE